MTHPVFSSDTDLAQALMGALLRRLPPVEGELLRRCATVQTFDRRLFEAVLVPDLGPPVPTFEQAARHRFVEALPGRAERYQVQSSFRTALFHTWWPERTPSGAIPEALRALSGR